MSTRDEILAAADALVATSFVDTGRVRGELRNLQREDKPPPPASGRRSRDEAIEFIESESLALGALGLGPAELLARDMVDRWNETGLLPPPFAHFATAVESDDYRLLQLPCTRADLASFMRGGDPDGGQQRREILEMRRSGRDRYNRDDRARDVIEFEAIVAASAIIK